MKEIHGLQGWIVFRRPDGEAYTLGGSAYGTIATGTFQAAARRLNRRTRAVWLTILREAGL